MTTVVDMVTDLLQSAAKHGELTCAILLVVHKDGEMTQTVHQAPRTSGALVLGMIGAAYITVSDQVRKESEGDEE